jgi:hypothetical protein
LTCRCSCIHQETELKLGKVGVWPSDIIFAFPSAKFHFVLLSQNACKPTANGVYASSGQLIILNAGTYNMASLIFRTDARLTINGTVNFNVNNNLLFDDRVTMTVSSINNVNIYTNSSQISFGEMTFKGNVIAPNAHVTLKSRINYRGSIKAKVLFFDYDAKLYDF